MRVVAVHVADGCEPALAAVLIRLADDGGLVIVQAVPPAAGGHQPHELLAAIQTELPPHAASLLVFPPPAVAELAALARSPGGIGIALVPVETVDPVPAALLLRDVLGTDEVLLAAQSPGGLVLRRIQPRRGRHEPWEGLSA